MSLLYARNFSMCEERVLFNFLHDNDRTVGNQSFVTDMPDSVRKVIITRSFVLKLLLSLKSTTFIESIKETLVLGLV